MKLILKVDFAARFNVKEFDFLGKGGFGQVS